MKILKKLSLVVFLLCTFISGCMSQPLNTPSNVQLNERLVTWSEVVGATSYVIKVNDSSTEVFANEFTLPITVFGSISVSVQAKKNGKESQFSSPVVFTAILKLTPPTNVRQEGNVIRWDVVEGAVSYIIKINGVEFMTYDTFYTIDVNQVSEVQVLAAGQGDGLIQSSAYSASITLKAPLSTPSNIKWSNGTLTWDEVKNATSYDVWINKTNYFTTNSSSLVVGFDYVNQVEVQIVAKSTNSLYSNSAVGTVQLTIQPLTLSRPTNLSISEGMLSFDAVTNANAYDLYFNGELYITLTTNRYNLPSSILNTPGGYIQVMAKSLIHQPSSLSEKVYVSLGLISNETELAALNPNGSYQLANDIVLTRDWTPKSFYGILNGNGHTISQINITQYSTNIGFFSVLDGASISNLNLQGSLTINSTTFNPSLGGLAGKVINSNINKVSIDMTITMHTYNGISTVGGAVGQLINSNLSNIFFSGTINASNAIAGGLIGKSYDPSESITVFQSKAVGAISVSGGEQSIAGGFIGQLVNNSLFVNQCAAEINVTGTHYVGGFVGYMGSGNIANSYALGTVSAKGNSIVHVGGFVGRMEGYNNQVKFSIAMTQFNVSASGNTIFVGSFVGVTPGGNYATIYQNCVYNSQLSSFDRIGNPSNGRGDGILGYTSNNLANLSSFDQQIWDLTKTHPLLKWTLS